MRVTARFMLSLLALLLAVPSSGQQLMSRKTEQLNLVYYDKAHEYLSYHLARSFENSLAFHRKLFNYTPTEPVLILMQDFGDYGHGGTSTLPWNYVSIGIEPFDYVYDTLPANERMNWLMHHELVHVVATDKAAGSDLFFRKLFRGKVSPIQENPISMFYSFLTSPRWYSPRWYHEGIAVFLETWMAGGVGRSLGGYDEMAFRTMVLEGSHFYDIVGLESEGTTIDFQVGQNSYLYGTRFVTWLAMQHGPDKLIEWFNRTPDSRRYFSSQFQKVYGLSIDDEWRRWLEWEHAWQKTNLALIRKYPVTPEKTITTETLGSVSRSFYDPERKLLYAAVNRPAKPAQIVSIDVNSGRVSPLTEVGAPALYFVTSIAYDAVGRKIFFTSDNTRGWRDLNELDLASGKRREVLKNSRTGDLVVHPVDQAVWGVQHNNGLSSLIRIPKRGDACGAGTECPEYNAWKVVLTLDYGRDIFDLDISPDGKTLSASMIDVTGDQKLIKLDINRLLSGDSSIDVLHEFEGNSAANFVFSRDGRYLFGTSYYTGVSNVFRFDLETRKMEAVSNAESGLFRPVMIGDDKLAAFRYSATGFVPVTLPIAVREDISAIHYLGQEVVDKYPIVKGWNAGSPARVDLDKVSTYVGAYRPLSQMRMASIYPVLEGYKNSVVAGVRANFSDPLGLHSVDLTAGYSPDGDLGADERLHVSLGYDHAPWKVRLRYNASDFYDLFGPTRTSRKGHSAAVSYHDYLIYERPRTLEYTIRTAYYGGLDTLPDFQNVRAPFEEYATVGAHIDFRDLKRTIGAVDFERGTNWSLATSGSYVNSEFFPRIQGSWDYGVALPLDHSSIWLRTSAGKSFGDRSNPFANFFFGGFGNNYVDYGSVRRYRDYESLPGVEINEIGGNDFAKTTIEWTLPPLRFEKVGVPALYTNWSRLALFSSGLVTDVADSDFRRKSWNLGGQVDFSVVMFSNLDATFSVGYAVASSEGESSDEVLISLKLLR